MMTMIVMIPLFGSEFFGISRARVLKKLKPDKFFMDKPSQNYGMSLKYGAHNYLQPDISKHIPP